MIANGSELNFKCTRGRRGHTADHATRLQLIDTVCELLDEQDLSTITSPMVLRRAGISKGSLYHHFEDFEELICEAAVRRFSEMVDQDIAAIEAAHRAAHDAASLIANLAAVTAQSQSELRRVRRRNRARMIVQSQVNPRVAELLGREQSRLTDCFIALIRAGQANGWVVRSIDPHAAAVLVQAYTFGRLVDDIASHQVDPAAWDDLIGQIVAKVLCAPE